MISRLAVTARTVVTVLAIGAAASLPAAPAAAAELEPISGAGSTWSANAIRQWAAAVKQRNITVNYQANGSSAGRREFAQRTVDYAVSEIPYGLVDSTQGRADAKPTRKFAYMPIVAGGTAFMYNLKINGRLVTNLRLSGDTVARIFTGVIKTWNDPAIKADNPGLNLPARPVVPVVRSDGSGTSAQFTEWMSKQHGQVWNAYCAKQGKTPPCGLTSYYPARPGDGFVARTGSDGVSGYVRQPQGEGAITYVEYSYARNAKFPVAKILNQAGYYIEPTARSVAVALLSAEIQTSDPNADDYLTQKLDRVYTSADKRTYPLSSYSYMIIPTELEAPMNLNKGFTLGKFGYYMLCEGQQQAESLGYSPLPMNLVRAGYDQVKRIKGVVEEPANLTTCNNPTFASDGVTNTLALTAPQPAECDRKGGPQQCSTGTGGANQETPTGGGTGTGTNTGTGTGTGTGGPGTGTGTPGAGVPNGGASVDPITGEPVGGGGSGGEYVAGVPVALDAAQGWRVHHTIMVLAAVLVLGLIFGPPMMARRLRRSGAGPVDRDGLP